MLPYIAMSVLLLSPVIAGNCVEADKNMWVQNREFPAICERIAQQSFGLKPVAIRKFKVAFPGMTGPCIECHAELLSCGAAHCATLCAVDRRAAECQMCIKEHCTHPYYTCLGYFAKADVPISPWEL